MKKRLGRFGQNFDQAKQGKQAFTNWPKQEVVLKGPDNIFCYIRGLKTPQLEFLRGYLLT